MNTMNTAQAQRRLRRGGAGKMQVSGDTTHDHADRAASGRPRRLTGSPWVLVAIIGLSGAWANAQISAMKGAGGAKVTPDLLAATDAITAGTPFEVAVVFDIQPEWHIYWENPGASGFPPQIDWKLPAGFKASAPRFPVPRRETTGGLTTFILEGKPALLVTITPPASLPQQRVTLSADLTWLVCKQSCIPENASVTLELPAVKTAAQVKPANESVFRRARAALPAELSRYVRLKPTVRRFSTQPGSTFDLLLEVAVTRGLHIQSNAPLIEGLIATDIIPGPADGITLGSPVYPEAHLREVPGVGRTGEFSGTITIRIPCTVNDVPPTGPVRLSGLFTFQACTDAGQCYPPETLAFAVTPSPGDMTATAALAGATPTAAETSSTGAEAAASGTGAPGTGTGEPGIQPTPTLSEDSAAETGASSDTDAAAAGDESTGAFIIPAGPGLWLSILFGFLGGLILNVMPCVLPVISIKILSFVQQSGEDRGRILRLGLVFCAGIMVWFWVFAWVASRGVIPLQHPAVVVGLTAIMFVFGLSLFGVFEIQLPSFAQQAASTAAHREGYGGAFFNGLLATLLGTACMAPLLAPALGWAATQGGTIVWVVFTSAGIGMASPYLLLSAMPGWLKHIPRPGNWMITFKQFMGFVLMGTAVWLLTIVAAHLGADGVVWTVAFLGFLAMSCWIIGKVDVTKPVPAQLSAWAGAFIIALFGGYFSFNIMYEPVTRSEATTMDVSAYLNLDWGDGDTLAIPWQPYRKGLARELSAAGLTVYVDYTAVWCATCQTNKAFFLQTDDVMRRMRELRVVPIEADYTARDPDITEDLHAFGQIGVPLNVIYPAGKPQNPIVLPTAFVSTTPILEALDKAGPSLGPRSARLPAPSTETEAKPER